MAGEEKDLMAQVGESFGIQEPQQQQPEGDEGGGEQQVEQQQPQQEPAQGDTGDEDQQHEPTEHRREPQDLRGDRSDRDQQAREQLFQQKPRKGPRGELLDKDGKVIASTRREKQLAYNLNRAQYAANQAVRENRGLRGQLQHFNQLQAQIQAANLSPQMVREALELRAMAERDPVLAVRDIVARVLASGVTMEQLFGSDAVPQINARVITNELDRRLGPLEQRQRAEQRTQHINEQAQAQMEDFVANHPHADTHGIEISNLVNQHGLTPEKAYYELRSWVERRGFDFGSPLRPQIEAAMRQSQRKGGRQPSTPGSMRGVQPNGSVPTHDTTNQRGDFRANAPWKDIARAVFTELNSKSG